MQMLKTASGQRACVVLLMTWALLAGCASVQVEQVRPDEVVDLRRGDILSRGVLSHVAQATLRSAAIEPAQCTATPLECIEELGNETSISDEDRLAAMAEVATAHALAITPTSGPHPEPSALAWLEVARFAYGYLFLTDRPPSARAFEERQNQVRDYYNRAAQHIGMALTEQHASLHAIAPDQENPAVRLGPWTITVRLDALNAQARKLSTVQLLPGNSLRFKGIHSIFGRDGFGSQMVAELRADPAADPATPLPGAGPKPYSRQRFVPLSLVVDFPAQDLAELLAASEATVHPYDPYLASTVTIRGQSLPLAANFSAGYGLWLARSSFARQAALTLFGRQGGIERPHIYLMQQFDPRRRLLLMIHGLASSPEAWVNLANEVTGDPELRAHYQIWQVYYPTNLPVPWNHHEIRAAVTATLDAVDPSGTSVARQDIVVAGHSMGGVLARLMVSESGDALGEWLDRSLQLDQVDAGLRHRLHGFVTFAPYPGVKRAIFMASPHKGTSVAAGRVAGFIARLIRTPLGVQQDIFDRLGDSPEIRALSRRSQLLNTSIDNLRIDDPFLQAAASLQIPGAIPYHSIIGAENLEVPLHEATDGVVPYSSAHLDGATSELIVRSDHHVQDRLASMLELRRILRLHLQP